MTSSQLYFLYGICTDDVTTNVISSLHYIEMAINSDNIFTALSHWCFFYATIVSHKTKQIKWWGQKPNLSIWTKSSKALKSYPFREYPQIKAFQEIISLIGIQSNTLCAQLTHSNFKYRLRRALQFHIQIKSILIKSQSACNYRTSIFIYP